MYVDTSGLNWPATELKPPRSSPKPSSKMSAAPGGQRTDAKRRSNAKSKAQAQAQTPTSTRAAGFGGSTASLLKLYTDEALGLRVDPLIVMFLAVGFIFSVIALHVVAKLTGKFLN